jgi:NADPH-dependent ferric siderophore reductase
LTIYQSSGYFGRWPKQLNLWSVVATKTHTKPLSKTDGDATTDPVSFSDQSSLPVLASIMENIPESEPAKIICDWEQFMSMGLDLIDSSIFRLHWRLFLKEYIQPCFPS